MPRRVTCLISQLSTECPKARESYSKPYALRLTPSLQWADSSTIERRGRDNQSTVNVVAGGVMFGNPSITTSQAVTPFRVVNRYAGNLRPNGPLEPLALGLRRFRARIIRFSFVLGLSFTSCDQFFL